MLRDEIARYTELSGNDGLHTPIGILGAYLDGYDKGRADAQPKPDENTLSEQQESDKLGVKTGETCTDFISRQAAIKAIEDLPNCYNGFSDTYDKSCIIGVLEELPSAQPERKRGKWMFTVAAPHRVFCSECYKIYVPNKKWSAWAEGMIPRNYCPNCGARMHPDKHQFEEMKDEPEADDSDWYINEDREDLE